MERLDLSTEVVKAFLSPFRGGLKKITVDTIKTIKNCFIGEYRTFHDFFNYYLPKEGYSLILVINYNYVEFWNLIDPAVCEKHLLKRGKLFRSGDFYFKEPKEETE